MAYTFQRTIGEKFAQLIGLRDDAMDIDAISTTYNRAVTDTASEIFGKMLQGKGPLVHHRFSDLCDEKGI